MGRGIGKRTLCDRLDHQQDGQGKNSRHPWEASKHVGWMTCRWNHGDAYLETGRHLAMFAHAGL